MKDNIMESTLNRLKKEAEGSRLAPLANQIGINYVTLWRLIKGKSGGSPGTWHRLFRYYKK